MCSYGIQNDVASQFKQIAFFLNQDGLVATLIDVADKMMTSIEILAIQTIQLAHALRQIRFGRFDKKVIVIAHLAKTMDNKMMAFADECK